MRAASRGCWPEKLSSLPWRLWWALNISFLHHLRNLPFPCSRPAILRSALTLGPLPGEAQNLGVVWRKAALLPVGCVLVWLTVWLRPGSIFNLDLWISLRDTLLWRKERGLLWWVFIQIPSVRKCLRSDSWEVEPEVRIRECCCHALMEKPKSEAGEQDREEVAKKGFGPW